MSSQEILANFDIENLPDLDVAALGALELLCKCDLPESTVPYRRPLIVGSAGAAAVGRMLFQNNDAVFTDESGVEQSLSKSPDIDGAVIISASGGKHAVGVAKLLKEKGIECVLFTNNPDATARKFVRPENVRVFPKNREPYTYNTSTYLSMLLADTSESAADILAHIEKSLLRKLSRAHLGSFGSFVMIVPPEFREIRGMFRTKFDELFGPYLNVRVFTSEEIKHAKTVVTSGDELFISFGVENAHFGLPKNRLPVPLPERAGYGALMAIGYFVIGKIQGSHRPYFKNNIVKYTEVASKIFGRTINPIVE